MSFGALKHSNCNPGGLDCSGTRFVATSKHGAEEHKKLPLLVPVPLHFLDTTVRPVAPKTAAEGYQRRPSTPLSQYEWSREMEILQRLGPNIFKLWLAPVLFLKPNAQQLHSTLYGGTLQQHTLHAGSAKAQTWQCYSTEATNYKLMT